MASSSQESLKRSKRYSFESSPALKTNTLDFRHFFAYPLLVETRQETGIML